MNALTNYDSDSGSSDTGAAAVASTSAAAPSTSAGATGKRRATAHDAADDEDDVALDPNDAFGLAALANKPTDASDSKRKNAVSADATGAKRVKTGSAAAAPSGASSTQLVVQSAPSNVGVNLESNDMLTRISDTHMHVNLPYAAMTAPLAGPENPYSLRPLGSQANTLTGHVEVAALSDFDFRAQQRTFDTLGYARDPSSLLTPGAGGSSYVGDVEAATKMGGASALELRGGGKAGRAAAKKLKQVREGQEGSLDDVESGYKGPWGGWKGEKVNVAEGVGPTPEEIKVAEAKSTLRKKDEEEMRLKRVQEEEQGTEKSVFHGKSMYDYQGRTYMHIPTDVETNLHGEPGAEPCFVPKACIHTWTGHAKGVSAVRLFPGSGHLMLSSSMDTKVKLWDVYHDGKCLRTFHGHSKAVKDVTFSPDGRRFLSASYDRQTKLWDTETGQCIRAFSNGKMPNVVKFHPEKLDTFLAGMSDKKITQFDINTGEITQDYDQHLGAVNSITFVDENRRFVTTSDDKTLRAWDFGIPVVIKYIADPGMHSMPAVSVHPNKKWLACQSLDNQIVVYAADSFRQNRKKLFKGHQVAGYACQVNFSPDGKFISSGDGEGNVVFWDWKSGRLMKRLRAHKEVVISHEWLPHETSKLVTGSWDGTIKLWD